MTPAVRRVVLAGVAAALLGALVLCFAAPDRGWDSLVVIGLGIAAGEFVAMRPLFREPLPLSYALFPVLARTATIGEIAVVVVVAEVVATAFRIDDDAPLRLLITRLLAAAATVATYQAITTPLAHHSEEWVVPLAVAAATIAALAVHEVSAMVGERRLRVTLGDRRAEAAVLLGAVLMTIGYRGLDHKGALGLWSPVVFCLIPLLTWYAYRLLNEEHTDLLAWPRAVSVAPEHAGVARAGRAERVASLALAIAHELGMPTRDVEQLETAALLDRIGELILDDPRVAEQPATRAQIAHASAEILHNTKYFARAGDIVAASVVRSRGTNQPVRSDVAREGQIIRVAVDFEDRSEGEPLNAALAFAALIERPLSEYDPAVIGALERVLQRRGLLGEPAGAVRACT